MADDIKEGTRVTREREENRGGRAVLYPIIGIIVVLSIGFCCYLGIKLVMHTNVIDEVQNKVSTVVEDITGKKIKNNSTENQKKKSSTEESKKEVVLNVTSEERDRIEVVRKSMSSVVSIAISSTSLQSTGVTDKTSNIGTGFIVDSSGIVITNNHVVEENSSSYVVVTSDGTVYNTKEILTDSSYDIAVIKIDNKDNVSFDAIELGDSDSIAVGQSVLAIGTPLGEYAGSVTSGIISGLDRTVTAGSSSWYGSTAKTYEGVIQTDAAINRGNSGGPLINSQGQVIGINFATTSGADNISFALPINKVKERLNEYKTYGKFIKAYLGVSYQMLSQASIMFYYSNSNLVPGAVVMSVESGSPADKAGIQKGDVITTFGGAPVNTSLTDMILSKKVGDEVEIKLYRNGEYLTVKAKLSEAD